MHEPQDQTLTLNNGVVIPRLGLGVYQSELGRETYNAVRWALEAGYRHIDTARLYGNEADVGRAVRDSGIPRGEIFVVTKLWNTDHGYDTTLRAFEESAERLGLGPVDLYLIHFPVRDLRRESWRALEALYRAGRVRAIGVSNYTVRHLQELLDHAQVVPTVNQVEFSPFLYQHELLSFCRQHHIQLEAYAPLTQGERLGHPTLVMLAARYRRTPAQIMLRWAIQHDIVVIPKSVKRARIEENGAIFDFDIEAADMVMLDELNEDLRVCWDPSNTP